jgi:hypothetical protein
MHSDVRKTRRMSHSITLFILMIGCLLAGLRDAHGQGNYEIQVYGSDTVPPKNLMVELHSNYTVSGQTNLIDGVYPINIRSTRLLN